MSRCLKCGVIAKHMYDVAPQSQPDDPVGIVCYECKELFGQNGGGDGSEAECGYHETCTESAAYVALVQRTEVSDSGDVEILTDREPILCRSHLEELTAESR